MMGNSTLYLKDGWIINTGVDGDGHLSLYVSNTDGTKIIPQDADIAENNEWAERFTSQGIEEAYGKSAS